MQVYLICQCGLLCSKLTDRSILVMEGEDDFDPTYPAVPSEGAERLLAELVECDETLGSRPDPAHDALTLSAISAAIAAANTDAVAATGSDNTPRSADDHRQSVVVLNSWEHPSPGSIDVVEVATDGSTGHDDSDGSASEASFPQSQASFLGRGASGRVTIAASPTLGRDVAVKTVNVNANDECRAAARCEVAFARRAADVLAADPGAEPRVWRHIAQLYGVQSDDATGECTVLAEPVLGGSLRDAARQLAAAPRSGATARGIRAVARQLLQALATLHSDLSTLHNDIKLENALLLAAPHAAAVDAAVVAPLDPATVRVKLIDFGCAAVMPAGALANTGATFALPQRGSLSAMAPERLRGEAYGVKAEAWSAGVAVLQLACGGRHPFLDAPSVAPFPDAGPPANDEHVTVDADGGGSTANFWQLASALRFTDSAEECADATGAAVSVALDGSLLPRDAGFRDFVHAAVEPDADRRASVKDLLQHPWLA